MINILDLFSGIGGFTLASTWVGGYRTLAFCEIEGFCRELLKQNFPGIPIFEDVKELHPEDVIRQREPVHLITAGFPCQDISQAGVRKGIRAERSGLFFEILRLSDEFYAYSGVRPALLLENVPNLLSGGGGEWARVVHGEVASRGYDCEWKIISAASVGAPHLRKRWWCIAYVANSNSSTDKPSFSRENDAEAAEKECVRKGDSPPGDPSGTGDDVRGGTSFGYEGKQNVAYSDSGFSLRENEEIFTGRNSSASGSQNVAYSESTRFQTRSSDRVGTEHGSRRDKGQSAGSSGQTNMAYSNNDRSKIGHSECSKQDRQGETDNALSCRENVAYSNSEGLQGFRGEHELRETGEKKQVSRGSNVAYSNSNREIGDQSEDRERGRIKQGSQGGGDSQGESEPGLGGVANGPPNWIHEPDIPRITTERKNRVNRLKSLGNSIVPQVAMIPLIRFREIYEEQNKT